MLTRIVTPLLLVIAALASAAAAPASAMVGSPLRACVRAALPGQTVAAMLDDPDGFDCPDPHVRMPAGDYWVRSTALPHIAGPAIVRSASVWQDASTLYVRYGDGAVRTIGFTSGTAWRHLRLGAVFELPLPRRTVPPVALLWHIRGANGVRGILPEATIATEAQGAAQEVRVAALYAAFAGLCAALLIYNLALWRALRQRFQPVYCLMVVCLMSYAFSASGLLGQMAGIDNNLRLRVNGVLLASSAIAAIAFARSFFEPRVFAGWLGRASTVASAVLAAVVAFYVAVVPWQVAVVDRACALAYLLLLSLVEPILFRAWRLGSRYGGMFALAWGAPVVLAACRVLASLDLIAWNFWLDNSTILAMALEASLSSLAIAYRIKLLSEERDDARAQETVARLLADSDPLTGLMNRRSFLREAIARGAAGADGPAPWVLVLVDIDHFKAVNDTLGHAGGDEVLCVFAHALRGAAPADALVARLGGEEFAVLAPALSVGLPRATLEAIRAASMPFDMSVTASIGSGFGTIEDEGDWTQLYRRADQALYAAKAAGRDRARWAA